MPRLIAMGSKWGGPDAGNSLLRGAGFRRPVNRSDDALNKGHQPLDELPDVGTGSSSSSPPPGGANPRGLVGRLVN